MTDHMDVNGLAAVLEAMAHILDRQAEKACPEIAYYGPVALGRLVNGLDQLEHALADYRKVLNEVVQ